jgi:hypothetical protein
MKHKDVVCALLIVLVHVAQAAWAVQDDGSLGAGLMASLSNSSKNVWLPFLLGLGFIGVLASMAFGIGPRLIQRGGGWILAILTAGGGFLYFSSYSGGPVSMTFRLAGW